MCKEKLTLSARPLIKFHSNQSTRSSKPTPALSQIASPALSSTSTATPTVGPISTFISLPSHVLQEKLYSSQLEITTLKKKLSTRPSLSATEFHHQEDQEKRNLAQLKLITKLQNQVRELEMVCEAQTTEAPQKIREDVEREWSDKVKGLEQRLQEREGFLKGLDEEVKRLRRVSLF